MNQPDKKTGPEQQEGHQQPLPLFRPEALASQQQKLYGDILLIRPLSLAFLGWLGLVIAASIAGFLLCTLGVSSGKDHAPTGGDEHTRLTSPPLANLRLH